MADTIDFKYEIDTGLIVKIRLLNDTELKKAYGAEPTDPITHGFHVTMSRNKNQFGVQPRMARWEAKQQISGTNPAKYIKTIIELPVLTENAFNALSATAQNPVTFTHNGLTYSFKSKKDQEYK